MHIFHTDFEFVISAEPFSKNSDLTLTPLHAPSELDFDLRTFDELQSSGFAEAKEIDFEGAVTAIEVLNKSDAFLLLLDGEAILGAKQNRICQKSMIVAPNSAARVPVNCIEQGRWRYDESDDFRSGDFVASPRIRERKIEMLKRGREEMVQQDTWREVEKISLSMEVHSASSDLGEIYRNKSVDNELPYIEFLNKWPANGYFVQGVGKPFIELFHSEELCKSHMIKSIRGLLADTNRIRRQRQVDGANDEVTVEAVEALSALKNTKWRKDKPAGCEGALIADGDKTGRVISLGNQFVHGFFSLGTSADV